MLSLTETVFIYKVYKKKCIKIYILAFNLIQSKANICRIGFQKYNTS